MEPLSSFNIPGDRDDAPVVGTSVGNQKVNAVYCHASNTCKTGWSSKTG